MESGSERESREQKICVASEGWFISSLEWSGEHKRLTAKIDWGGPRPLVVGCQARHLRSARDFADHVLDEIGVLLELEEMEFSPEWRVVTDSEWRRELMEAIKPRGKRGDGVSDNQSWESN